ncbi:hypothetical protein, partial [Aeromonas veronii]|uniref:hypothetical protein n=1 Tax=Aeromonas veronii TaxID=654 RepID=UPI003D24DBD6
LEYRPVTPGVAGSSPVRSATNLKAFLNGKAFLLWAVFAHKSHWFAYQNQHAAQSDDWAAVLLVCW